MRQPRERCDPRRFIFRSHPLHDAERTDAASPPPPRILVPPEPWPPLLHAFAAELVLVPKGDGPAEAGATFDGVVVPDEIRDEVQDETQRDGEAEHSEATRAADLLAPVISCAALADPALRESFLVRVFARGRLRRTFRPGWRLRDLVDFHTQEKLLLLAHHRVGYDELGRFVAGAKERTREAIEREYPRLFLSALAHPATAGSHANALRHAAGHFRGRMEDDARLALARAIDAFQHGDVSLREPLACLRELARRHHVAYLERQSYLHPDPREERLRFPG